MNDNVNQEATGPIMKSDRRQYIYTHKANKALMLHGSIPYIDYHKQRLEDNRPIESD